MPAKVTLKTTLAGLFTILVLSPAGLPALADVQPAEPRPCIVPDTHAYIQDALDDAALGHCEEDTVTVLPGDYHEYLVWPPVDGITLTGTPDGETILGAGPIEGTIITFDGTTIVPITEATRVSRLTIEFGLAGEGGGIRCIGASPTIEDCHITRCWAMNGAGIYSESGSPVITRCLIDDNYAQENGGGIYALSGSAKISDCTVTGNEAHELDGGGIWTQYSETVIKGCTIGRNRAGFRGAGVFAEHASQTIVANEIWGNSGPSYYGGGIASRNCTPIITDNVIYGNDGGDNGGGLFY